MDQVMNNNDLRRIIWSFLKKKICHNCRMDCYSIKEKYVEYYSFTNCYSCFRKHFLGDKINLFNYE